MSDPEDEESKKLPLYKAMYRELEARLDKEHGPSSLGSKLSQRDLRDAEEAAKVGARLYSTYPRLSPEELAEVVSRAVRNALPPMSANLRQRVTSFLTGAILGGVMGNATWDIMKNFIPYLHTFFMSADTTDYMKRSAAAYEKIRAVAPSELHNFASEYYRGLQALRIKTWQELGKEIKNSELGSVFTDLEIQVLLEGVESHLFVPVRK